MKLIYIGWCGKIMAISVIKASCKSNYDHFLLCKELLEIYSCLCVSGNFIYEYPPQKLLIIISLARGKEFGGFVILVCTLLCCLEYFFHFTCVFDSIKQMKENHTERETFSKWEGVLSFLMANMCIYSQIYYCLNVRYGNT